MSPLAAERSIFTATKNKQMKKNVLVFGLISGALISIFMSGSMIYMSKNPNAEHGTSSMVVGFLSMIIAFSLIFVAVKTYRDKQNGGVVGFGKAFLMGVLIALIGSTMYVITWAFVHHYYLPDFMEKYAAAMIENARATSTPEELQKFTVKMNEQKEMYKNPVWFSLFTYMEILPVGLIVALISALILKRKKAAVA
jgi:Protein of unknown function (DUF4199)